jgi:hypothetical protein
MALIITPTTEQKIYVQGTTIELPQVYNRLEFLCRSNGITMEVTFATYADHIAYTMQSRVPTDLPTRTLVRDIDILTQVQGMESAHQLAKAWYESLGYTVTIDLV